MTEQGELFAAEPIVPGLALVEDAVSAAEEAALAARIDAAPLAPFEFGQWRGKRLTANYGSAYDYQRARPKEAPPLPDWLLALRTRLAPQVARHPAPAPPHRRRLRSPQRRAAPALALPAHRRGARRVGAFHRADGRRAPLDHAAHDVLSYSAGAATGSG
jgi:hypothetical protein